MPTESTMTVQMPADLAKDMKIIKKRTKQSFSQQLVRGVRLVMPLLKEEAGLPKEMRD